jgi:hypothetical protein
MDKMRKFFEWLWLSKERFVLAAMVLVLCWNLYRVVYPEKLTELPTHRPPSRTFEDEPLNTTPLAPAQTQDWASVYTPNPFWALSGKSNKDDDKNVDAGITLLEVRKVKDKARAKLQTESAARWYDEGESFESFELMSVDLEAKTCQVRSERLGKVITLQATGE